MVWLFKDYFDFGAFNTCVYQWFIAWEAGARDSRFSDKRYSDNLEILLLEQLHQTRGAMNPRFIVVVGTKLPRDVLHDQATCFLLKYTCAQFKLTDNTPGLD